MSDKKPSSKKTSSKKTRSRSLLDKTPDVDEAKKIPDNPTVPMNGYPERQQTYVRIRAVMEERIRGIRPTAPQVLAFALVLASERLDELERES